MCVACDDPIPDEIPGDPETVRRFSRAFRDTAEALRDAARELRNVANENITISLAIDEVRSKADEVTADTARVATRYQGAADTFGNYAEALDDAQRDGNGARSQIIANNDSARYWRHRERDLRVAVQLGTAEPEVLEDFQEATRHASHHDAQYATYLGRYAQAREARDQAVTAAIAGLDDAAEAAGLDDGFFEAILGDFQQAWATISKYLGPVIELIREALEVLKKIVDILALIVTIASIFFPALAPIALALTALSAILAIAVFACSLVLFTMGRESLGRVISDGIMAVVGVVTAKLGGAGGLFETVKTGFAQFARPAQLFLTRGTMINLGLTVGGEAVERYGATVMQEVASGALTGTISANATPIAFVIGEGLDFQLGADSGAWGAEPSPAWDMTGADGTKMLPGVLDSPTFGTAGPIAGIVDVFAQDLGDLGTESGEIGEVWGQIGAVPAT